MTFAELAKFITRDMRMAHIYQPVMLLALLRNSGRLPARAIAKELLQHDESQIEYYTAITNNMVGKVLRNRGIVEKDGQDYVLTGFPLLKANQVKQLIADCQAKLEEYKAKRGAAIWEHRRVSAGFPQKSRTRSKQDCIHSCTSVAKAIPAAASQASRCILKRR